MAEENRYFLEIERVKNSQSQFLLSAVNIFTTVILLARAGV